MSDNSALITIVVPAHNAAATLDACLASVRSCDAAERLCHEIIVVDDGSSDETSLIARRHGARLLRLDGPPVGPAAARNHGVAEAHGAVILFLDADVCAHHDTLARAASHFESADGPDAVFGSYDDTPAVRSFISVYKNLFHHYIHQTSSVETQTFWAGCGAIRRSVFAAVRGFDESYRKPSIEDIELGYRLHDSGFRIVLDKDLQVKHLKHWTFLGMVVTDVARRAIPWGRLLLSRRSLPRDLNLRFRYRLSVALAGLVAVSAVAIPVTRWSGLVASGVWILAVIPALLVPLVLLNLPLYSFFARKVGLSFAIRSIPVHWFYYLYCGAAMVWIAVTPAHADTAARHQADER